MNKLFLFVVFQLLTGVLYAQTIITANDMPAAGDTLRYSSVSVLGATINVNDTGANKTWDYSNLVAVTQAVDSYKTALQVNPLYGLTAPTGAYGYKVADSFPLIGTFLPVAINQLYTFFQKKTSPNRFEAVALGMNVSGFPVASKYTTPDTWYFLPLAYGNRDSSAYSLPITLPSVGSIKQEGYRITTVVGWGTIQTPYFTTPVNCIMVKSVIHEIDSIHYGAALSLGIPRNTVEYKWLTTGEHYPALWVSATIVAGAQRITSITFRDKFQPGLVSVPNVNRSVLALNVFPNPAIGNTIHVSVPDDWKHYEVEAFDMQGKLIGHATDDNLLNIGAYPPGTIFIRVTSGTNTGFARFVK